MFISGAKAQTIFSDGGKYGLMDSGNKIILPAQYDKITKHNKFDEYHLFILQQGNDYSFALKQFWETRKSGSYGFESTIDSIKWNFRTTPSGGGLFPVEMYCLINNVKDIPQGIYLYNTNLHSLEQIKEKDIKEDLIKMVPTLLDSINNCAFCIVLSATFQRIKFKYKERAYRFVLLEAGHIAQNILLASESEGYGALPIGGFLDDPANKIAKADGVNDAVLYLILIGTK